MYSYRSSYMEAHTFAQHHWRYQRRVSYQYQYQYYVLCTLFSHSRFVNTDEQSQQLPVVLVVASSKYVHSDVTSLHPFQTLLRVEIIGACFSATLTLTTITHTRDHIARDSYTSTTMLTRSLKLKTTQTPTHTHTSHNTECASDTKSSWASGLLDSLGHTTRQVPC